MATYVEYQLDDGSTLLIEVDEQEEGGVVKVARDDGNVFIQAGKKFREAIRSAKASTLTLLSELNDLPIDEMQVSFGLKSTGEAGFFAVGKVGMEANYQVTLKWKKPSS